MFHVVGETRFTPIHVSTRFGLSPETIQEILPMMSTMETTCQTTPLRMSLEGADIFRKAVKHIITEWPSLNLAIENGMGGPQAQPKRDWMCGVIAEAVMKDKDIDLEDYLGEMINQEFDALIEDGSLEYNCQWISKFHQDCLQGKEAEVIQAIEQAQNKAVDKNKS